MNLKFTIMKTHLMIIIFLCGIILSSLGQNATLELTFTATYEEESVVPDSILIQNLTQGGDTTLYAPDSVLVLDYITGIRNNEINDAHSFSVSQNYPNPMKGKTSFDLNLPDDDDILISVRDILGKELIKNKFNLKKGFHSFVFYPESEMYYLLTVTGKYGSKTIKMVNAISSTNNTGGCKIVHETWEAAPGFKTQKALNAFMYSPGDELRYSGYATNTAGILGNGVIKDEPQTNTNYEFVILKGLRCQGEATVTDIDGNIYNTVQIGTQCWMKENLKTTTYSNGTAIPHVTNNGIWGNITIGAYVWYDNDISWKDSYGALYNRFATIDTNGLCPTGWHVPTIDEWTVLDDYIPDTLYDGNALRSCRTVNSPLGGGCNTNEHPRWEFYNNNRCGTDNYGFSALPGGGDDPMGGFGYIGYFGFWWSSSDNIFGPVSLFISYNLYGLNIGSGVEMQQGMSVRCLRD